MRDFYATMAQVMPIILLALIWESRYLDTLRTEDRHSRAADPMNGVRFWTKPRVRAYAVTVTVLVILDIGISVFVLAGVLDDSAWLRGVVVAGLVVALVSLLFRITVDIFRATEQN